MTDLDFSTMFDKEGVDVDPNNPEQQREDFSSMFDAEGEDLGFMPYTEEDPHPLAEGFPGAIPPSEDAEVREGEADALEMYYEGDWGEAQLSREEAERQIKLLQHRVFDEFSNLNKSPGEEFAMDLRTELDDLGLPSGPITWDETREVTKNLVQVAMTGMIVYGVASVALPAAAAGGVGAGIVYGLGAVLESAAGIYGFMKAVQGLDYLVRKIKGYEHVEGVERGFMDLLDTTHMSDRTLWALETVEEAAKLVTFGVMHKGAKKAGAKIVPHRTRTKIAEGLLRDTIRLHSPENARMYLKPEEVMASVGIVDIKNVDPKARALLEAMGISRAKLAISQKYGLPIEIPTEKVLVLKDKPFWAKLKKKIRMSPYEQRRVEPFKKEVPEGEAVELKPYQTDDAASIPVDKELSPEYTPHPRDDLSVLEDKMTIGEIETKAREDLAGLEFKPVEAAVAPGKKGVEVPEFDPLKVETISLAEAIDTGLIDRPSGDLIQAIMTEFPQAWKDHFSVEISNQEFRPSAEQLSQHGVPKRQHADMRMHGALLTEKIGPLLEDARHVAVMFKDSNVGTFFHEFGHFVETRLLNNKDLTIVNSKYSEYKTAGDPSGKLKDRTEWFADEFKEWWMNGLWDGKIRNVKDRGLANLFRKILRSAKNIWKSLRRKGQKGPMDALFEDVITNGRELNEKFFFSEQEMTARYVTGVEPDAKMIRDQGIHGNQKTWMSYDPGTQCPKQVAFVDYMIKTAKELGLSEKDLADNELIASMYDTALLEGIDVPCSYCYVEEARAEAIRFHRMGKSRMEVIGAKAKPVVRSVPYVDKILKFSDAKIAELNKRGGLRMFSFSDYVRSANRTEVDLLLKHCKERGLSVKAITKNPEFVEDFGDTGITINLSIDWQAKGGPAVDWDVAVALQKKYPNVKIRTVARNPEEVRWFLTHDKLDVNVITPFHGKNQGEFVDMSGNSKGGQQLRAIIEENPKYAERVCCQVGGRCFSEKHQKQCASNCGNLADNLSIPADIGFQKELKPDIGEDATEIRGRHVQDFEKVIALKHDALETTADPYLREAQERAAYFRDRDNVDAIFDSLGYNLEGIKGDPGVEAVLNSRDGSILKEVAYNRFVKVFKKDIRKLLAMRKMAALSEVRKNIDKYEPYATVKKMSYNERGHPVGIPESALLEVFELADVQQLKTRYPGLVRETAPGSKKIAGTKIPIDEFAQMHGWEDAGAMVSTLLGTMDVDSRVRLEADAILKSYVGEAAHPVKKAKAQQTYKWTIELTRMLNEKFKVTREDMNNLLETELKVLLEEYFEFGEDVLPEVQEAPYDPTTPPRDLEPQFLDQMAIDAARLRAEKLALEKPEISPYEPKVEGEFEVQREILRRRISQASKDLAEKHSRQIVEGIKADIDKVDYNNLKVTEDQTDIIDAELNKDEIRLRRSYRTGNLNRVVRSLEKKIEKMHIRDLEARARKERRKIHSDMVRWSEMSTVHPDARKVLAEMAGGIDPVARRAKTARKVEKTLAFINEAREMGEDIPWEHDWFVRVMQDPIDTLFMADMRAMHQVAKNVAHLGKLKQKLISSKIQRDFMKSQEERLSSIRYHNKLQPMLEGLDAIEPPVDRMAGLRDMTMRWGSNLKKVEYTLRHVDGRQDGPNQELIEWQVDADMRKELISKDIFGRLDNLFTSNRLDRRWAKKKTNVRGIGMVSNAKRVAIALHSGAKGNREAMMGNKVYKFTDKILDDNLADLSPAERNLVEGIWALFEKDIWPLLAEAHVKMTGIEPEFVKNYYPLNFDPKLAIENKIMNEVQVARESLFYHKKVNDRMTIARRGGQLPPDLSLTAMHRSISDTIHYITHSAVTRDMSKVLRDVEYRRDFTRATSEHHWRELENHVKNMAAPHMVENPGGAYDKFFSKIRRNYTLYSLGLNVAVGAKQTLSILNLIASKEVGPRAVAEAFGRYLKNPVEAHRYVKEMSPEMDARARSSSVYRDLYQKLDVELNPLRSQLGRHYDTFKSFMMSLIRMNDMFATTISFLAGEGAALRKYGGNKMKGIRGGNRAVRRTQPSALTRDLPPIARKGEISKAISMFYSFLSVVYNMNSEAYHGLIKDKRLGHFMAALMFVNILPGIAARQIDVGARERRFISPTEAITGAISLPLAGVPLVRDVGNFMINQAQGKYQGQYQIAPYEGTLNKVVMLPKKAINDWNDENYINMALEMMDVTAMLTGLPGMQMKRTIEGARQLEEGETEDWTRLAFPE